MSANWTRLIRFIAAETSRIHIGQPVDASVDVGLAVLEKQGLKAYEISGTALDSNARVTDTVLTVKHLMEPLSRGNVYTWMPMQCLRDPPDQVKLVRCLGLNYKEHAAETGLPEPKYPILFYKPATSLIGPNAPIMVPKAAQPVKDHLPDYEVELTIVIGKDAKNVSEADALDYVLGYVTGNDMSFRYHQMAVSQWGFSKGFDDATPFGPCIVSSRALKDPHTLPLKSFVNGQLMQDGNTSDFIFNVRQTIAFLSQGTTLEAGSMIMTGTPSGVGFARKPPVYLKDGDEVRCWIGGGMGTLVNRVIEEKQEKISRL